MHATADKALSLAMAHSYPTPLITTVQQVPHSPLQCPTRQPDALNIRLDHRRNEFYMWVKISCGRLTVHQLSTNGLRFTDTSFVQSSDSVYWAPTTFQHCSRYRDTAVTETAAAAEEFNIPVGGNNP